ncbi:MAG: HEAT repeat domain-containing protein [Planctomycetaceae bacterium]|nr:HEAT repeat domain-containing protein [Planctomycetaceae bacterium]
MNLSNVAVLLLSSLLAAFSEGCTPPQEDLAARFQSDDPQVRIEAIREAGKTKNPAAVPFLIDRLSDSQMDIRLFAIMALRDITGQTHGYEVYEPAPQRAAAVARWRQWLAGQPGGPSRAPLTQPAAGRR